MDIIILASPVLGFVLTLTPHECMSSFSPSHVAGVVLRGLTQRSIYRVAEASRGDLQPQEFESYLESSRAPGVPWSSVYFDNIADQTSTIGDRRGLRLHLRDVEEDALHLKSRVAYVTVLLGDDDRGIRTLGQSLLDSRTIADLVAILGPQVSEGTEIRLHSQGWRIRRLAEPGFAGEGGSVSKYDSTSGSPGVQSGAERFMASWHKSQEQASRLREVLAHASAWELTEYERVVLLEDTMLVVENVDDLFLCGGVCAAMKQGEIVSSALIVLEPAIGTYESMVKAFRKAYSFSNDFEGFLNYYLDGFENCLLFDLENPALRDRTTDPARGPIARLLDHSCHRIPTRYSADLAVVALKGGLDMVRVKGDMPSEWRKQKRARVVRFAFAGLRPWTWSAVPFMPFASIWRDAHVRATPRDPWTGVMPTVFWWVVVMSAVQVARAFLVPALSKSRRDRSRSRRKPRSRVGNRSAWSLDSVWPRFLLWLKRRRRHLPLCAYNPRGALASLAHVVAGYSSLICGFYVGARQVPTSCSIWISWAIFILWTGTVVGVLWPVYIWIISRNALQPSPKLPRARDTNESRDPAAAMLWPAYEAVETFRKTLAVGGLVNGKGDVSPPSPWGESLSTLVLLALVLAFMPAWQPLSGASSLWMSLGPVVAAIGALVVVLTVQMLRLPPLWCDQVRLLALLEAEGLRA